MKSLMTKISKLFVLVAVLATLVGAALLPPRALAGHAASGCHMPGHKMPVHLPGNHRCCILDRVPSAVQPVTASIPGLEVAQAASVAPLLSVANSHRAPRKFHLYSEAPPHAVPLRV